LVVATMRALRRGGIVAAHELVRAGQAVPGRRARLLRADADGAVAGPDRLVEAAQPQQRRAAGWYEVGSLGKWRISSSPTANWPDQSALLRRKRARATSVSCAVGSMASKRSSASRERRIDASLSAV